jgi:hypothetical protein
MPNPRCPEVFLRKANQQTAQLRLIPVPPLSVAHSGPLATTSAQPPSAQRIKNPTPLFPSKTPPRPFLMRKKGPSRAPPPGLIGGPTCATTSRSPLGVLPLARSAPWRSPLFSAPPRPSVPTRAKPRHTPSLRNKPTCHPVTPPTLKCYKKCSNATTFHFKPAARQPRSSISPPPPSTLPTHPALRTPPAPSIRCIQWHQNATMFIRKPHFRLPALPAPFIIQHSEFSIPSSSATQSAIRNSAALRTQHSGLNTHPSLSPLPSAILPPP